MFLSELPGNKVVFGWFAPSVLALSSALCKNENSVRGSMVDDEFEVGMLDRRSFAETAPTWLLLAGTSMPIS